MPSITVKDIPDELYSQFKAIAQAERRSVNSEVIVAMVSLYNPWRNVMNAWPRWSG